MAFTKITEAELKSRGCTTLPNQPAISAEELKQEFDAPAKEIVAPKFNNLIDELEANTAAASLGAIKDGVSTNIQALLNEIKTEVGEIEEKIPEDAEDIQDAVNKRHTHANKTVIDKFSEVGGNPYYNGNPIGGSVTVDSALSTTSENPVQNKVITNTLNSMGTPAQIAAAVQEAHTHSNKALLDTYTQSDSDIADAVAKKHTHSNKSILDKISEDGSGNPTFNGDTIITMGETGDVASKTDILYHRNVGVGTGAAADPSGELLPPDGTMYFKKNSTSNAITNMYASINGSFYEVRPYTISTVDIGEGQPLTDGVLYLVVEP